MKYLISTLILVATSALTASAQDTPKAELFAGYSYLHTDDGASEKIGFRFPRAGNANGWNVSIGANVTSSFAVVADFSGHYLLPPIRFDRHSFLLGPKYSLRHERFTAFTQALFGASLDRYPLHTETAFALTAGGGIDLNMSKRFAARLIQLEYARATSSGISENNVRISAGVVFRIGVK